MIAAAGTDGPRLIAPDVSAAWLLVSNVLCSFDGIWKFSLSGCDDRIAPENVARCRGAAHVGGIQVLLRKHGTRTDATHVRRRPDTTLKLLRPRLSGWCYLSGTGGRAAPCWVAFGRRASAAPRDASSERTAKKGFDHARFTDGWSPRESTHWPGGSEPEQSSTAPLRASHGGGGNSGRRLLRGVSQSSVEGRECSTCVVDALDVTKEGMAVAYSEGVAEGIGWRRSWGAVLGMAPSEVVRGVRMPGSREGVPRGGLVLIQGGAAVEEPMEAVERSRELQLERAVEGLCSDS